MESNTSPITAVGAILVAILLIVVVFFIFNRGTGSARNALASYSKEDIEAFNTQYEPFKGTQKGSNVIIMMSKLITSANTNKDNPDKLPTVTIDRVNKNNDSIKNVTKPSSGEEIGTYISNLGTIKTKLEPKHEYDVTINYGTSGFVDEFVIKY